MYRIIIQLIKNNFTMKTEMNFLKTNSNTQKNEGLKLHTLKHVIGVFLAVLLVASGISQVSAHEHFNWGLKAGINASTQSEMGNICDNTDVVAGFNGGLTGRYGFNSWLGLRSELDFRMKGTQCEVLGVNSTNRLNYLLLPVKAEFSASEKAGLKNGQRVFFATGPYAGYLLNAKQIKNDVKTDLDLYNDFDYGWSFEIGYMVPVKNNSLQFSLNYDMGIADVADNTDIQNKSASFSVAWLF